MNTIAVLDYIADVKETHEDLKKVSTVLLLIRIPVAGMGFLPYVGPAFRVFGNLMARLQQMVDKCKDVARRIVETIDRSRIEPNVQTLVDKAGELQIYLNTGTYTSEAYILGSIVIASSVCPSTASRPCNYVWDKLQHFNNLLDRLRNILNHLANLIMQLYNGELCTLLRHRAEMCFFFVDAFCSTLLSTLTRPSTHFHLFPRCDRPESVRLPLCQRHLEGCRQLLQRHLQRPEAIHRSPEQENLRQSPDPSYQAQARVRHHLVPVWCP